MNYEKAVENIRQEIEDYVVKGNIKSLVLGVSGGIDSALVAVLVKPVCDKLQIPLIGRTITIETNTREEIQRAIEIGEKYCTDYDDVDFSLMYRKVKEIDSMYTEHPNDDDRSRKIRLGNIKARMRMIYLYNTASSHNGLVLSTDNLTEYLIGFWTLHGDVGDFGPIQELYKTEVYEMAEWLVLVEGATELINTINGDATDGLGITKTDLDQILPDWQGSSKDGYRQVDRILYDYVVNKKGDESDPVIQRHLRTEFKRNVPISVTREEIVNVNKK